MAKKTEIMVDNVANTTVGETVEANEDGYVAIKWSEYKELLITKGKYEELSSQKSPVITYGPRDNGGISITTPYPQDLTPKYPNVTLCNCEVERQADGSLGVSNKKMEAY